MVIRMEETMAASKTRKVAPETAKRFRAGPARWPKEEKSVAPKSFRAGPARPVKEKKFFELEDWYPSDEAKRSLGSICQHVNEQGREIGLLGSEERPTLILVDARKVPVADNEVDIAIDEAKADWSAVTAAALFYGTVFRIRGKKIVRAVLRRHPVNRHSAIKYRRVQPEDLTLSVQHFLDDMRDIAKHFDETTDVIRRQFTADWRSKNMDPPT